jgi:ribosomal protein L3
MPGRMGGQYHTIKHLEVLQVDDENGILVLNGNVAPFLVGCGWRLCV